MRATAFDQEVALAQGISVGTVFALSWAIAGALAAVAGVFVGTGAGVDQQTWIVALIALPAIILGGLDSVPGAVDRRARGRCGPVARRHLSGQLRAVARRRTSRSSRRTW